jgi:hypothetical protein
MTRTVKDADKPWRKRPMQEKRNLGNREIRNLFRIYCEGENTEPEYFKSFPVNTETKVEAIGFGMGKTALVEKAIDLFGKEKLLKGQGKYDADRQLWVVFDYDNRGVDRDSVDYNNAISLAQQKGIRVAYSNDSFELWLVLHYQFQTAAVTRYDYYRMLSDELKCNYEELGKTKQYSKSLYDKLLNNQSNALQNARRLFDEKANEIYSNQNPCTTVYQLVEELNKCIRK